jgi:TM2 domain-containing membrane protein YozV
VKKKTTALFLAIFLGVIGIDRFYLGYTLQGIIKLVTVGGFGIWWLVDIFLIATGKLKDAKGNELV